MATNTLNQISKPKTHKGKKALEARQPQLIEPTKNAIFVRGATANDTVTRLMKDIASLKKPHSIFFSKKNDWKPFEDATHVEFMSLKNETPLFMFASHNKKRPNNLIIGRTFDHQVLDMFETGVENYKSMAEFKTPKVSIGTKPIILFSGEQFEQQHEFGRFKNLMLDFFSGPKADSVRLSGLENVMCFIAAEGKVYFRHFRVVLKKSGTRLPRVELEEIGPRFDLAIRRHKLASDDMFKRSMKTPKELKPKKVKNVDKSALGTQFGRVHMERQDYGKLSTRKMKGLKRNANLEPLGERPDHGQDQDRDQGVGDREEAVPRVNKRIKFNA